MSLGRCHTCNSIIHNRNTLIEESKCGRLEKHIPNSWCRILGQWNRERSHFRGDDETFVFLRRLLCEMMNICIRRLYIIHLHEYQTRMWVSSKLITSRENTIVIGIGLTEVSKSSEDLIVAWNTGFSKLHNCIWTCTIGFCNMITRKSEREDQYRKQ